MIEVAHEKFGVQVYVGVDRGFVPSKTRLRTISVCWSSPSTLGTEI